MITRSLLLQWSRGAFVEELPGANTQGDTLEEARANLVDAVRLILEANRTLALEISLECPTLR